MIRVIQRRLIIPRGDTGVFTIPAMTQAEGAIGVFTIFDPITNTRIFQKQVEIEGENFNISFSHADTVNLKAGEYLWDIKFYKNPILADNKVIDGEEINSYYAAFQAPKCEIRETGDDFLMIEGQPAKIEDLNIILGATEAANAAKVAAMEQAGIAATKAEEAAAKLEEMMAAMPTKVSELENDSGYLQEETDPTVPAWAKAAEKPTYTAQEVGALPSDTFIPSKVSDLTDDSGHYVKPANGIPASDLEETYLTQHQDISMKANSADLAAVATSGAYSDLNGTPTNVSAFTNDAGYLTAHQDISGKADKSAIPTKVSQLQNDSGYLTSFTETDPTVPEWAKAATKPSYTAAEVGAPTVQEMNAAISTAIGSVNSFDMAVVQELPMQDISTHTIYLVPKTGETNDVYDEYVYINDAWEMVGNTQIDLSNYVQKTDYATVNSNQGGIIKVDSLYGLDTNNGTIRIYRARTDEIKDGSGTYRPLVSATQHYSTFYGLAKAAGDTTQSQSDNAVGTYTDEAKAAIQTMFGVPSAADLSLKADKTDTVLETTLSRGRTGTAGAGSIAFGEKAQASGIDSIAVGYNVNASGRYSTSFGAATKATGDRAVANGMSAVASGPYSHAEGDSTVASGAAAYAGGAKTESSASSAFATGRETLANKDVMMAVGSANTAASQAEEYPTWVSGTLYHVGDKVYNPIVKQNFECLVENNDVSLNLTKWRFCLENSDTLFVVGNGKPTYSYFDANNSKISVPASRSNAFRVDWDGNGKFNGDVYVGANADSTGGTKVLCEADFATAQDIQNIINGGAGA